MRELTIGYALCGSYCTFEKAIAALEEVHKQFGKVIPIMSENAAATDSRFGTAESFKERIRTICGREIITTIAGAEPIGPKALLDVMVIAPCTGNTIAKLAAGITDSSVTMAAKAHLRNSRPVVIAVSTNDGLTANAKNIGTLLNRRNIYFVPFYQDDPIKKTGSVVADFNLLPEAITAAVSGRQLQPILREK
jgi:dipicolinate synthase subunit B